ncbi:MAG TPA: trehalose-phosphatase [Jiangellales bacterium]|nr:trehalose-phosphatase [Jiangellales bacterium]
MLRQRQPAVSRDFDGTLSDIVAVPDAAVLVNGAAGVLARLARRCPVAVISGRNLRDVRRRVGLDGIWDAGSHGLLPNPYWPEALGVLTLSIRYREHPLLPGISSPSVEVTAGAGLQRPIEMTCRGQAATLTPGSTIRFPF